MKIAVLGIDLGKTSCSVVGLDGTGHVVMRRRMHRDSVIKFASGMAPCVVAMEACCGAHHLGRIVRDHGHQVRLMSPEYVRPYVKAQKNDDRDAEAIAEAATRPTMRFVELKSAEQLDMQSLHRVRDRLVGERTALINQLRAVLMERGITVPQGRRKLEQHLAVLLDGEELRLSPRVRSLVEDMRAEWGALDRRIEAFDDEFAARAKTDDAARRLATIPGIGVLNATALAAAVGNAASFARGRDLAAWLDRLPSPCETKVGMRDREFLRETALRTWRFFDEFSNPANRWLISDRLQQIPARERLLPHVLRLLSAVLKVRQTIMSALFSRPEQKDVFKF